jgi:hypothetical protein
MEIDFGEERMGGDGVKINSIVLAVLLLFWID